MARPVTPFPALPSPGPQAPGRVWAAQPWRHPGARPAPGTPPPPFASAGRPPGAPGYRPQPYPAAPWGIPRAADCRHYPPRPKNQGLPARWVCYGGALGVLLVAVVLITGFGAPGFFVTRQLDIVKTQAAVEHLLADPSGYGAKRVSDVTCNDGQNPTIAKGATFTCEATIDRIKQQFVVTFTDDEGGYQVGPAGKTTGA